MTGVNWGALPAGNHRLRCPACGRSDRDRTLGVTVERDRGVGHCFRCGHVETQRGVTRTGEARSATTPPARHTVLSDFGRNLWAACRPLAGEARAYLEARACVIPPADGHLRWHPALRHPPSGLLLPALVALLTDARTGEARSLHRTWIRADGQKATVDPPRMLLGGHTKAGTVCRLWPDEAVTHGLGVGEGIESALSLAHGMRPVWACIDAGNLADFPVLAGIEALTVAVDHDPAGIAAAQSCARRWHAAGCEVRLVRPATPRADLNDVAQEAAA